MMFTHWQELPSAKVISFTWASPSAFLAYTFNTWSVVPRWSTDSVKKLLKKYPSVNGYGRLRVLLCFVVPCEIYDVRYLILFSIIMTKILYWKYTVPVKCN